MNWRLDHGQIEVMDDAVAETLRRKPQAETIEMLAGCFQLPRGVIEGPRRTGHPI